MTDFKITSIETKYIRFPTSENLDRSDAMNSHPHYSAAYLILKSSFPK
jgi:L-fuconate dehydratase